MGASVRGVLRFRRSSAMMSIARRLFSYTGFVRMLRDRGELIGSESIGGAKPLTDLRQPQDILVDLTATHCLRESVVSNDDRVRETRRIYL